MRRQRAPSGLCFARRRQACTLQEQATDQGRKASSLPFDNAFDCLAILQILISQYGTLRYTFRASARFGGISSDQPTNQPRIDIFNIGGFQVSDACPARWRALATARKARTRSWWG